jgi:hypothetical protein
MLEATPHRIHLILSSVAHISFDIGFKMVEVHAHPASSTLLHAVLKATLPYSINLVYRTQHPNRTKDAYIHINSLSNPNPKMLGSSLPRPLHAPGNRTMDLQHCRTTASHIIITIIRRRRTVLCRV